MFNAGGSVEVRTFLMMLRDVTKLGLGEAQAPPQKKNDVAAPSDWDGNRSSLFKMDKIWSVDSQESCKNCCHQSQILRLKCTKFEFGCGCVPAPAGEAYSAPPHHLAGF